MTHGRGLQGQEEACMHACLQAYVTTTVSYLHRLYSSKILKAVTKPLMTAITWA